MPEQTIATPKYFQKDLTRLCPFDVSFNESYDTPEAEYCLLRNPFLIKGSVGPNKFASPAHKLSNCEHRKELSDFCGLVTSLASDLRRYTREMPQDIEEKVFNSLDLISHIIDNSYDSENVYRFIAEEVSENNTRSNITWLKELITAYKSLKCDNFDDICPQKEQVNHIKKVAAEKGVL